MRRLVALMVGCGVAYLAQELVRGAAMDPFYAMRDGLLLVGVGAILAAIAVPHAEAEWLGNGQGQWPLLGWIFCLAGTACAMMASLLFYLRSNAIVVRSPIIPTSLWVIAVLLVVAGARWSGRPTRYPLPTYRWVRDASGHFVRRAMDKTTHTDHAPQTGKPAGGLAIWAILLLGAGLRFWQLAAAPPGCTVTECQVGLQMMRWAGSPGETGSGPLYTALGALIFQLLGSTHLSLRVVTAAIGIGTIAAFYGLARGLTGSAAALLATTLLALAPLHLWFSRSATPLALTPLLLCMYGIAFLQARSSRAGRGWMVAGVAFGLLLAEAYTLRPVLLVWGTIHLGFALLATPKSRRTERSGAGPGGRLAGFLFGAGIALSPALAMGGSPTYPWQGALGAHLLYSFPRAVAALVQPGSMLEITGIPSVSPLDPVSASLAIVGLGIALRHIRGPWGLIGCGLPIFLVAAAMSSPPQGYQPHYLNLLLPLLFGSGAIGCHALWRQFSDLWRHIVRPVYALAAIMIPVAVMYAIRADRFQHQLVNASGLLAKQQVGPSALGAYLNSILADQAPPTRVLVPPQLLLNSATQFMIGPAGLANDRLVAAEAVDTIPYGGPDTADLVYVIPVNEPEPLILLQEIYPAGTFSPQRDARTGATLFSTYRVTRHNLAESRGITGFYYQGRDFGPAAAVQRVRQDGPLRFDWSQTPPMPPPFSVRWQGTLLVRRYGTYTFRVEAGQEGSPVDPDQPVLTVQLDRALLLDTSLRVVTRTLELPAGLYGLDMAYRSGTAATDLSVIWATPDGVVEILPRTALLNILPPNTGLLGAYRAGLNGRGEVVLKRKERLLRPNRDLAQPYQVVWQGKVAAPISGDYLFTVSADGLSRLWVDDQLVLDDVSGATVHFVQGSLSLRAGWHDLRIQYEPAAPQPEFQLGWQPPGRPFDLLSSRYLAPLMPGTSTEDLPLPDLAAPNPALTIDMAPSARGAAAPHLRNGIRAYLPGLNSSITGQ